MVPVLLVRIVPEEVTIIVWLTCEQLQQKRYAEPHMVALRLEHKHESPNSIAAELQQQPGDNGIIHAVENSPPSTPGCRG